MVYIAPDGTVHQNKPWGISRITDCFWNVINFIVAFFRTLIPGGSGGGTSGSNGSRGSADGPGGPGGPGGPRRRMGGIKTMADCNIPGGG